MDHLGLSKCQAQGLYRHFKLITEETGFLSGEELFYRHVFPHIDKCKNGYLLVMFTVRYGGLSCTRWEILSHFEWYVVTRGGFKTTFNQGSEWSHDFNDKEIVWKCHSCPY
jgi:hypothetical protein